MSARLPDRKKLQSHLPVLSITLFAFCMLLHFLIEHSTLQCTLEPLELNLNLKHNLRIIWFCPILIPQHFIVVPQFKLVALHNKPHTQAPHTVLNEQKVRDRVPWCFSQKTRETSILKSATLTKCMNDYFGLSFFHFTPPTPLDNVLIYEHS